MADKLDKDDKSIDILLGVQLYGALLSGSTIQLGDNLFLIDTKLGYVLSARLKSTLNRYNNNDVIEKCDNIFKEQLELGIIEPVDEKNPNVHVKHYLNFHPVITPQRETTKIRVVFCANTKLNKASRSLNDYLHTGPTMLEDLISLLIRFRTYPYVLVADIEKAFLQVCLNEKDKDVTRFIWGDSNMIYSYQRWDQHIYLFD
ncbi:hypothetical protein M8J77_005284 [Diaphorina citri]|nr:hypothetical protein M8J77_005284 [Diaphorina citri]